MTCAFVTPLFRANGKSAQTQRYQPSPECNFRERAAGSNLTPTRHNPLSDRIVEYYGVVGRAVTSVARDASLVSAAAPSVHIASPRKRRNANIAEIRRFRKIRIRSVASKGLEFT